MNECLREVTVLGIGKNFYFFSKRVSRKELFSKLLFFLHTSISKGAFLKLQMSLVKLLFGRIVIGSDRFNSTPSTPKSGTLRAEGARFSENFTFFREESVDLNWVDPKFLV